MIERLQNPVFRQSSRQRMRGVRTYGCLLAYLLTLSLVLVVTYEQFVGYSQQRTATGLAQMLFETLTLTQWFLVAFIAPALTTGAISMEREQRTMDLLIITPLSRFAIVWGKFASAMAFVMVLILCGMPLVAALFLLGGVDLTTMLMRYLGMLVTGAVGSALGLAMSTICTTTTLANLITYGLLGTLYFVGAVGGTMLVVSRAFGGPAGPPLMFAGLTVWQTWAIIGGALVLIVWLLLQIAANYLLPDPRVGAWKTRMLSAVLYVLALAVIVREFQATAKPFISPNMVSGVVAFGLLGLAAPVSTGVLYPGRRWFEWLHPRALFTGAVQSAPLYLLLLLVVAIVADFFMPPAGRTRWLVWGYVISYYWWLWSLGYLFSTLIANRWGAMFALVGSLALFMQFLLVVAPRWKGLDPLVNLILPEAPWDTPKLAYAHWVLIYPALGIVSVLIGTKIARRKKVS
ncbi:MAG: ABC transporter permease [Armatimonadota bacterium]